MSNKLKTCFLISVYINDNLEDFKKAIDSCINQTVLANRIIIVFDGAVKESISNYCNNIKSIINIEIVKCTNNVGLGAALNKGFKYVKEDIVIRMDSDDISRSNRVEKIIDFFYKNPNIGVVGSYISEFNESIGDMSNIREVPLDSTSILNQLKFSCPFNHVSVAFKFNFLPSNPYEINYYRLEDYPTWYKLLVKHGLKSANIDEVLVDVKLGKDFFNKRKGLKLYKSWFRVYSVMYNDNYINFLILLRNNIIRFIQFNLLPKKILMLMYNLYRK
ncbi:glycosyl transferase family 2 [Lutibacter sp. Hel_I_33_5]|uniref:glycosyltransferase n=1 Tax=Lutibacter sp. Hel_I_33_5 TaxID=1566289 RepID=UPI00119CB1C4|nr:glycosyltransferase [Lutibacter sp. Hel_I_33_5]TVZ55487.1 glycosyl transferase family 2 [Lutibacter sp. Hel_I_33_5]